MSSRISVEEFIDQWPNQKTIPSAKQLLTRLRACKQFFGGRPSITAGALIYLSDLSARQSDVAEFYQCIVPTLRSRKQKIAKLLDLDFKAYHHEYESGAKDSYKVRLDGNIDIPSHIWAELNLDHEHRVRWEILDKKERSVKLTFIQ